MTPKPWTRLLVAGLTAFCALGFQRATPQPAAADPESAYRANNVGIAYLEQFDYEKAAAAFRQALAIEPGLGIARFNLALSLFYGNDADGALTEATSAAARMPDSPQAHYLLGLLARSQNRTADAIAEFRRVLQRDPGDVGTKVNLGQVYLQERNYEDAVTLLKEAIASEPYNVTAAYNLATALTRSGAQDTGRAAMERFQTLRDSAYGNTYAQTYLAQGKYAEGMSSTGAEPELVNQAAPKLAFTDATATMVVPAGAATPAQPDAPGLTTPSSGVTLFDRDGDGDLDLVTAGRTGLQLFDNARGVLTERPVVIAGSRAGVPSVGVVAADYDNDGRPDLFVLAEAGNRLLHQRPDGGFDDVTARAGLSATVVSASAAFADVDHDGDLDLFIAGYRSGDAAAAGNTAANQLLRNNGDGTFTDITEAAKVTGGAPAGLAVVPTDFDNRRDLDLLVVNRGRAPALFQNMRDGSFRDVAPEVRLPGAAEYTSVAAADVNKDGYTDFYFGQANGAGTFAMSDGSGHFVVSPGPDVAGTAAAQFVDVDNDGLLDLVVLSSGVQVFRRVGAQWMALPPGPSAPPGSSFQAMAAGDLDGDGDEDIVTRLSSGALRIWRNDGGNAGRSLAVKLAGRVSNRLGVGSRIDVRAGSLRQRLESSAATPSVAPADLLFGLGSRAGADAVRVLWPSGTLQAEVEPGVVTPAGRGGATSSASMTSTITVTELDRKPSSCPYLYTWNGSRFEFVTDFMGGGELGYWLSPHEWHQPDPDEYVRIREDQLRPRDGRYEIRITNELEETMFVDRLQLIAVDHPADAEAYPNEGLKEGAPGFGLTTTRGARPVRSASDDRGRDVRDRLAAIDRAYVDGFPLSRIRGYAETHTLTLDLGVDADRAVLLMTGWTDYAFSADNVAASHSGRSLTSPSLEVQDAAGAWKTIIDDIGVPVGRPQTVVVNLRGKAPAGTRRVRIVTNMRIYWDQVLVDASGGEAPTTLTRLEPEAATLRWRGFSAETSPDGREPYGYDYSRVTTVSPWKQMTGRYTREGDVRPLLTGVDDLFVVSRPGDEIALSFDASRLPPLKPGTRRTFLLYADGYSKEMDVNSASPDSVEPMPFHGMTAFPYGPNEHYPRTPAHEDYLANYNTRVIARAVGGI